MIPVPHSYPSASREYSAACSAAATPARHTSAGAVPRRAVIATRAEESQVCAIRRFFALHVSRWGLTEQDRDSVVLIIGELAGNAARHGGADLTVSVSLDDVDLCIDVIDSGPSKRGPVVDAEDADDAGDEHGRGLDIVGQLAGWTEVSAEPNGWRSRAGLRVAPAVHASAEALALVPSQHAPAAGRRPHVGETLPAVEGGDRDIRPTSPAAAPHGDDAPVAMTRPDPRRESENSSVALAPAARQVPRPARAPHRAVSRVPAPRCGEDRLVDVRRISRGSGRIRRYTNA